MKTKAILGHQVKNLAKILGIERLRDVTIHIPFDGVVQVTATFNLPTKHIGTTTFNPTENQMDQIIHELETAQNAT